jgi:hypothetical protein
MLKHYLIQERKKAMKTIIGLVLFVICLVCQPLKAEALNKAELIDAVAAETGLTKADSKKAIDAYIKTVNNALKRGDKVTITGFGTLQVVTSPQGNTIQFLPVPDLLQQESLGVGGGPGGGVPRYK